MRTHSLFMDQNNLFVKIYSDTIHYYPHTSKKDDPNLKIGTKALRPVVDYHRSELILICWSIILHVARGLDFILLRP